MKNLYCSKTVKIKNTTPSIAMANKFFPTKSQDKGSRFCLVPDDMKNMSHSYEQIMLKYSWSEKSYRAAEMHLPWLDFWPCQWDLDPDRSEGRSERPSSVFCWPHSDADNASCRPNGDGLLYIRRKCISYQHCLTLQTCTHTENTMMFVNKILIITLTIIYISKNQIVGNAQTQP